MYLYKNIKINFGYESYNDIFQFLKFIFHKIMDLKKNWHNKFMMNYSFNGLLFPPHKIKIKLFKEDIRRFIGIFNLILYLFVFNKNLDPAKSQDNGLFFFFFLLRGGCCTM